MNSTWLLLRIYRVALILVSSVAFVVFAVAMYLTAWTNPLGLPVTTGFFAAVGFVFPFRSERSKSGLRPDQWPFPITVYQRAWLPFLLLLIFWLAGITGGILGLCLSSARTVGIAQYLASIAYVFPAMLFLAALLCSSGFLMTLWLFGLPFVWLPKDIVSRPLEGVMIAAYPYTWPLYIVLALLYFIERPIRLSSMDRGRGLIQSDETPPSAPFQYRGISVVTDTINRGIIAALYLPVYINLLAKPGMHPYFLAASLSVPVLLVYFVRGTFRKARLQGFGLLAAGALYILRATLVFAPLAYWLGLEQSPLEKCGACGGVKFLYNPVCPHCKGAAPRENTVYADEAALSAPQRKLLYKLGAFAVPVLVALSCYILTGSSVQSLLRVEAIIDLAGNQDPATAAKEIASAVEKITKDNATPAQYRIEIFPSSATSLNIVLYGLRWDNPANTARTLAEKALAPTPFKLSNSADCPVTYLRNPFLDNKVHCFDRPAVSYLTPLFRQVGRAPQSN